MKTHWDGVPIRGEQEDYNLHYVVQKEKTIKMNVWVLNFQGIYEIDVKEIVSNNSDPISIDSIEVWEEENFCLCELRVVSVWDDELDNINQV